MFRRAPENANAPVEDRPGFIRRLRSRLRPPLLGKHAYGDAGSDRDCSQKDDHAETLSAT